MDEYPVRVGSMLFTLVDPWVGHEVPYNRWYERDHFYAGCLVGPGLFAGGRWVATRPLKDLRYPEHSPVATPTDRGSYLATYWVHEGMHEEHFTWASRQVHELYAAGRGFDQRTHAHTALYLHRWRWYRDADPVPVELALDHPYPGLVTIHLERSPGNDARAFGQWLSTEALPDLLGDSPVHSVSGWTPVSRDPEVDGNAPMELGSPTGGKERLLLLAFCDRPPQEFWDRIRAFTDHIEASGQARTLLAAPFVTTIPGTDTYTDQLW